MAGNTVNVNVAVTDNGNTVNKRTKETKELNQELTKAAELSRKAQGVGAKYKGTQKDDEYGRARGAVGTGASARDFAKEARGLGGLVHVYATVAANLFAVTAAFGALKDAMNTTNMVNGMNQLGSASGVALGSMAQRFVEATDGAVSLREAMASVTKASSAGLSSKQVLDIAKGAKQASQALGLDMTDAVSRLTRGITKLEPELIDELGLYTKLGPAADKYALSIGKTAANLTDYEKRQAYAVAVLDELKQKFGDINLEANPYEKLASSIRNLAQTGLELVNKVLGPIASVLASNSTLLGAVLAGLAFKLLKMAVPALTSWRNELVKAADAAKKHAAEITESFASKNVEATMAKFNLPELQKNLDAAKHKYAQAVKDLTAIQEKESVRQTKTLKNIASGVYGQDPKDFARTQAQINDLNAKNTAQATAYADALKRVKDAKRDELKYTQDINAAHNLAEQQFQKSNMSEEARRRISRRAGARAESLGALAQVGADTERGGFKYGLAQLEKNITSAANMSGWDKLKTRATGWAIAGATEAKIFLNSLAGVMNVIGILGAVFGLLDAVFSTNSKALGEFNGAIEQNSKTVETAISVVKKYGDTISAAGSIAKGNTFAQLTEDIAALADKLEKTDSLSSWFDRMVDDVKQVAGHGLKQDFADSVAANLAAQLKLIPEGPLKAAAEEKLKSILEVGVLSEDAMRDALAKTSNSKVVEKGRQAGKALEDLSRKQKNAGEIIKQVGEQVKTADEQFMALGQSLALTDPVSKFGKELMAVGLEVTKAFQDTESTVGAVEKLLEKPRILGLLGPGAFQELTNIKAVLPEITKNIDNFTLQVDNTQKELDRLANIDLQGASQATINAIDTEKAKLKDRIGTLTINLEANKLNFTALNEQLSKIVSRAVGEGYSLVERMASAAQAQAAITVSKNLLQGLSGPGIAKAMGQLNIKEIDLQVQQNSIMATLNNTMLRANALKERELASQGIKDIQEKAQKEGRQLTFEEQNRVKQLQGTVADINIITGTMEKGGALSKEQLTAMNPTAATFGAQYAATTAGTRATNAALEAKRKAEQDNITLGTLKEAREESLKLEQSDARLIDLKKQQQDLTLSIYEYLSDSQMASKQQLELDKQAKDQELARRILGDERVGIQDRLNIAQKRGDTETAAALNQLLASKDKQISKLGEQQVAEQGILSIQQAQARIANDYAKINKLAQDRIALQQIQRDIEIDSINNQMELFGLRSNLLLLTPDEIANTEKVLKSNLLEKQSENDRLKAAESREQKLRKLSEDEAKAKADLANYDAKYYADQKKAIDQFYDSELERINRNNTAKQQAIDLQYSMTDRMKAYDQAFQDAFRGMGDVMVEFAKTGKLSFKDLIDSMIAGLIRYEMQLAATSIYRSFGGLSGILAGMNIGGTTMQARAASTMPGDSLDNMISITGGFGTVPKAKGAAYIGGVEAFGRGGAFTNSIVSSPTLFKFAHGTGLMGEAGPEAIMPLKRDSNGSLGVVAQSSAPSVDIVVNNYSNAQATTKETTDSRGNRKIEVVIGEMVAGEMSRTGSTLQQSMQSNFNSKPVVARR